MTDTILGHASSKLCITLCGSKLKKIDKNISSI